MFLAVPEPRQGKNRHAPGPGQRRPFGGRRARTQLSERPRSASFDEYGTQWTTLADPEGNVFDIGVPHEG